MQQKIIKQEQGRSMVEMLGTLAIIGVLSVGGIAGYTYAMNKYYANELLAGASARAVIVASQLASGRESSLSEFDKMKDTAGGTFDGTVKEFDDGIGIKVSGVKKAVCENLIKDTEGTDIGIETEAGGEVTCGDENTFFITFASLGVSGGETSSCTLTDVDCPAGVDTANCVCENTEGEICDDYTTNQCGLGFYCQFSPSGNSDEDLEPGTCRSVDKLGEYKTETIGGVEYTMSSATLDWWSANTWCQALNKRMASSDDLGCDQYMICSSEFMQELANTLYQYSAIWTNRGNTTGKAGVVTSTGSFRYANRYGNVAVVCVP